MQILEVNNLTICLKGGRPLIDNISFALKEKTILGIIGESGSGKSITTKAILKLLDDNKFNVAGTILFEGQNISGFSEKQMQK